MLFRSVDRMEDALQKIIASKDAYKKVKDLKRFKFAEFKDKLHERFESGQLTEEEMNQLIDVEHARWDAVQVDEFKFEDMKKSTFKSQIDSVHNPLD